MDSVFQIFKDMAEKFPSTMFEQSPSSSDAHLCQPFTEEGNFLVANIFDWERSPKVEDRPKLKGSWESLSSVRYVEMSCACAYSQGKASLFKVLFRQQLRYTYVNPGFFTNTKLKAGGCRM